MTIEQKRAGILKKRLDLINSYLVLEFVETNTGKSFADFLKYNNISREQFIKDLPPPLQNPPSQGLDNLMAYAHTLNQLLINQYLIAKGEEEENEDEEQEYINRTDGGLTSGIVDPDYVPQDRGLMLGCNGCSDCPKSADGDCGDCLPPGEEREWGDVYPEKVIRYEMSDEDGSPSFSASGGCGLPPLPPPFPKVKKIKKSVEAWDKYNAKKAKYKECRKKQKAGGMNLSFHLINLSNPGFALGRGSFNQLIKWNVFGMAQYFKQMMSYNNGMFWDQVKAKWYNLGGDPAKLIKAVEEGKGKKPIFKPKGWKPKPKNADGPEEQDGWMSGGGYGETAAIVGAAAAILAAIVPIVNAFKKSKGDKTDDGLQEFADPGRAGLPPGGVDPETGEQGGDDGGLAGMSKAMKWTIGLAIGVPVLALGIWGVSKALKNK